jgi:hypothetical protein
MHALLWYDTIELYNDLARTLERPGITSYQTLSLAEIWDAYRFESFATLTGADHSAEFLVDSRADCPGPTVRV